VPETPSKDVLGLALASRFGVAASVLTSARWVAAYARLGFDLLTYKTVRSVPWRCHEPPNWLFLEEGDRAHLADPERPLRVAGATPPDPDGAFAAGSFGIPSSAPAFWEADIAAARAALGPGQALVVSIVGTVLPESREADVLADLAGRVRAARADAVEANLSCPNVRASEGEVFRDATLSGRIARAVRAAAGSAPVLVKVGHVPDPAALRDLLRAVAGAADAVTMINAPSRRIVAADGSPAFGPGRERAGVIGDAIFPLVVEQLRRAVAIEREDGLGLRFVAVGGVNSAERARVLLDAGAAAVQCASAAVWNPWLASEIKRADPGV
jgi:dihydroorotate dehydrogenase